MQRCCEVCEGFRPRAELAQGQKLVELHFETQSVVLCVGHARIAQNSGIASFEALRAFYGRGRRSFVGRRSRANSAAHPERRRSGGRRAADVQR
ncbi:MAG TPA: hypothetical protein VGK73_00290 [Polyangiaceae bacterium]